MIFFQPHAAIVRTPTSQLMATIHPAHRFALLHDFSKSGRGLPHSMTLPRGPRVPRCFRQVLECASPLALFIRRPAAPDGFNPLEIFEATWCPRQKLRISVWQTDRWSKPINIRNSK
jgi:hypothetical protein